MDLFTFVLPNGIKIVHQYKPYTVVSHCGLIFKIGSRDEQPEEFGLAHFMEHVFFKGTEKRKSFHILKRLDAVGGELNAYTTKEELCIYASFINKYYERAIELIADISFNSTFPEKELEKEKEVVLDEIVSYADNPSETLFEDFESILFKDHPLEHTILGTKKTVKKFSRKMMLDFLSRNKNSEEIVFTSVGNISPEKIYKLLLKHINVDIPVKSDKKDQRLKISKRTIHNKLKKPIQQVHYIAGKTAYSLNDEKRRPAVLLANIIGGGGMDNLLNLNIREKYGYTYHIEANYQAFSDAGIFSVYFSSEQKNAQKIIKLIEKELNKFSDKGLSERKFKESKEQLKGHIALSNDSNLNLMLSLGKTLLHFNTIETIEEVYDRIDSITMKDFKEVTADVLDFNSYSSLMFVPKK